MNELYIVQRDQNGPFRVVKLDPVPDQVIGFDANGLVSVLPISASGGGDAKKSDPLSQFANTTSAQLNSIITDNSGTGALLFGTGPTITNATLVTPSLGVATVTSINKLTITTPATGSTLTIVNGKTLLIDNTLELAGTDSTKMTFPTVSGTVLTADSTATITNKTIGGGNNTINNLPTASLANKAVTYAKIQAVSANSKLLGSGSSGATLSPVEITLGAGLSMSGTTLSGTSAATSDPIWDVKGDLLVATGDNAATRLAAGADGKFLITDSSKTTGLDWTVPILNFIFDPDDNTKTLSFDLSAFPTATDYTLTPASGDSVTVIPQTGTAIQGMTGVSGAGAIVFENITKRPTTVSLSAQTASIATANLQVNAGIAPQGLYRVVYYAVATTAGTSGTLDVTIGWNDGTAARTDVNTPAITFGATNYASKTVIVKANGAANVTYSTTVTSPVGSPAYALYITMERLQ